MIHSVLSYFTVIAAYFVAVDTRAQSAEFVGDPTTIVVGTVRSAISHHPIQNAELYFDPSAVSAVRTDSSGRFVVKMSRLAAMLGVRKEGSLEVIYPLLNLTSDTLFADIELRSDPPQLSIGKTGRAVLPVLCFVDDSRSRSLAIAKCESLLAPAGFAQRIIKHNPWNPYFGPAAERSGALVRWRL